MSKQNVYLVREGKKQRLIQISEIITIEANEQFGFIRLSGHHENDKRYTTKHSLKHIESTLCTIYPNLIRVSKSFIVNIDFVDSIEKLATGTSGKKEVLVFKQNIHATVSVGRSYKKNLLSYLNEI